MSEKLSDLENNYLDKNIATVYRGNTIINILVDGKKYFTTINDTIKNIKKTGLGDSIFIVGWQFDPNLDLDTGISKLGSDKSIGGLLAQKCAVENVDVRIILNGTLRLFWLPLLPWGKNLNAAETLRTWMVAGYNTPPLADRVLFDWSGSNWSGTHHQKATIIKHGNDLMAFVGGMDMVESHWDDCKHNTKKDHDDNKWGWHDIGVYLHGEAAKGVWENFRLRWLEASTLPDKHWKKHPNDRTETPKSFNPKPIPTPPNKSKPLTFGELDDSVQILRSRYKYKIPKRIGCGGKPWVGFPEDPPAPGAFFEVFNALKTAINAATKYIYIEDQFLQDMPDRFLGIPIKDMLHNLEEMPRYEGQDPRYEGQDTFSLFPYLLNALMNENNNIQRDNLKLIFVGSGRKDPIDPGPDKKNQKFTESIKYLIKNLPTNKKENICVWRLEHATVHSKLMIIDDKFASIGSANFTSRSMFGIDSELQAAIVSAGDLVKNLRMDLWSEHWRLIRTDSAVNDGLQNLEKSLGLWNSDWYPADKMYWVTHASVGDLELVWEKE